MSNQIKQPSDEEEVNSGGGMSTMGHDSFEVNVEGVNLLDP